MENTKEHQVVLRVMRLTKPSFLPNIPIVTEECDLISNVKDGAVDANLDSSNIMLLPQSFGSIFLGETFVCYLSINNDSSNDVTNINLKADLQTSSQKTILFNKVVAEKLQSGSSNDHIISHEVKELGIHILVCVVTYCNSANELKLLRKFFKFEVLKPLDVKTKSYNVGTDKLFLETQIQNITEVPICMEKVNMEPSPLYTSKPLNCISDGDDADSLIYLNPMDMRKYLYKLELKPEHFKLSLTDRISTIGKLDIVWKSNLGERGRLQTSQLQRAAINQREVIVKAIEVIGECVAMKPFEVKCRLTNLSEEEKNLDVKFDKNQTKLMWLGVSGFTNGSVASKSSQDFVISLLPVCSGLQNICGLSVTDVHLNRVHHYNDIYNVLISPQKS